MQSEALRNVRTMRQVKNSLDVARAQKPRTTNSLSKTKQEIEELGALTDRRLGQILEKERRRFAAQEAQVDKSRQRILKSRKNLAMAVNKNRALNGLRQDLQQERWKGGHPTAPATENSAAEGKPRRMVELTY